MTATEVDGWDGEWVPESCRRGHDLTPDNVYLYIPRVGRKRWHCRTCRRIWQRGDFGPVDNRRLSFDPLDDASGETLAVRYGVTRRTICRWRADGIPWRHAEDAADRLGVHPLELWADFYELEAA